MVTFSKRRNIIYTKLSEISILCSVDVVFLIYSGAEKPFTSGSPSFDAVSERFLCGSNHPKIINGEASSHVGSRSSLLIMDAHKKLKMDDLFKTFNNLMEETYAEEEKRKMDEVAYALSLPVKSDAWWKVNPKEDAEAKMLLQKYEEFYGNLCKVADAKIRGRCGVSTSSFPPANFTSDFYNRQG